MHDLEPRISQDLSPLAQPRAVDTQPALELDLRPQSPSMVPPKVPGRTSLLYDRGIADEPRSEQALTPPFPVPTTVPVTPAPELAQPVPAEIIASNDSDTDAGPEVQTVEPLHKDGVSAHVGTLATERAALSDEHVDSAVEAQAAEVSDSPVLAADSNKPAKRVAKTTVREPAPSERPPEPGGAGTGNKPPKDGSPPAAADEPGGEGENRPEGNSGDAIQDIEAIPRPDEVINYEGREPFVPPILLRASNVHKFLGVSPGQFSRMRPELFSLVLGGRTYRFPEAYLESYERWLDWAGEDRANPANAANYALTNSAEATIERIKADFKEVIKRLAIPDHEALGYSVDAVDFAEFAGVNEQTVDDWRRDTGLIVRAPGWRSLRQIPLATLSEFVKWHYPRSYNQ